MRARPKTTACGSLRPRSKGKMPLTLVPQRGQPLPLLAKASASGHRLAPGWSMKQPRKGELDLKTRFPRPMTVPSPERRSAGADECVLRMERSVERALLMVERTRDRAKENTVERLQVAQALFNQCLEECTSMRSVLCQIKDGYERGFEAYDRRLAGAHDLWPELHSTMMQPSVNLEQSCIDKKAMLEPNMRLFTARRELSRVQHNLAAYQKRQQELRSELDAKVVSLTAELKVVHRSYDWGVQRFDATQQKLSQTIVSERWSQLKAEKKSVTTRIAIAQDDMAFQHRKNEEYEEAREAKMRTLKVIKKHQLKLEKQVLALDTQVKALMQARMLQALLTKRATHMFGICLAEWMRNFAEEKFQAIDIYSDEVN
eukprot:TRINITY_DN23776_c0_g1_i1.p1 TRINITY_DN23776_c0_g1~~TRINITY_DN23776_c0_g1_i1.p1  ORF type:complete len:373 (+),score=86.59 TRINITY_DN23776_c0_g1_i1:39-1157(+)